MTGCGILTAAVRAWTTFGMTVGGFLPASSLSGGVRVHMFLGEVAVTAHGRAIPLLALVTACGR